MAVNTNNPDSIQRSPLVDRHATSSVSATLQMVGFLSVLVFLINYTLEVLRFNHLYESRHFLLIGLQLTFSVWAMVELFLLTPRQTSIPLQPLKIATSLQGLIGGSRLFMGDVLHTHAKTEHTLLTQLDFGLATVYVPLYILSFLAVSRFLIEAFSHEERQRSVLLNAEVVTRLRIEEQLREANEQLQILASEDTLTGLWRRWRFEEAAVQEIARTRRFGVALSLAVVDVDHFKKINDQHGHMVGDEVLIRLADVLRHNLRTTDVLARWGGEEFVILLPNTSKDVAIQLMEKLRSLIAMESFPVVGAVTVSGGLADLRPDESFDDWFTRADQALYEAKKRGRNRICLSV